MGPIEKILKAREANPDIVVVIDNEAGLENLSRRIVRRVDLLVMVTDPSRAGFTTVERLHELVGAGGQDAAGLEGVARVLVLPPFPQSGKGKRLLRLQLNVHGSFCFIGIFFKRCATSVGRCFSFSIRSRSIFFCI